MAIDRHGCNEPVVKIDTVTNKTRNELERDYTRIYSIMFSIQIKISHLSSLSAQLD